jgi:hypothetical protein
MEADGSSSSRRGKKIKENVRKETEGRDRGGI